MHSFFVPFVVQDSQNFFLDVLADIADVVLYFLRSLSHRIHDFSHATYRDAFPGKHVFAPAGVFDGLYDRRDSKQGACLD